ncbi:unnamed protein product [Sphacelaria rigidula]
MWSSVCALCVPVRLVWQFFHVPDTVTKAHSSECMDFMMSFVCDHASRLGKRNVDEIKRHPWFQSLNWETLRDNPAPYKPEQSDEMAELMESVKSCSASDPQMTALVKRMTANFDEFAEVRANPESG